jgi:hypothetical protein
MRAIIREYNSKTDKKAVMALVKELQDSEKTFDPRIPQGVEVAEPYFKWMMKRCGSRNGSINISSKVGSFGTGRC